MSIIILCLTMLIELALYRVHAYRNNLWANAYRRPHVAIKARHLVNMDRISTNRY